MKQKCNCWIGAFFDYGYDITLFLDEYIEQIKEISKHDNNNIEDFLNEHKDDLTLFNYCPLCGKKINWKKLKERLENEI